MKTSSLFSLMIAVVLLFSSNAPQLHAQSISISTDSIFLEGGNAVTENDFIDLYEPFIFKNINAASDSFIWVRSVNQLPSSEWESAVCDINLCYPSHIDSAIFEMQAGDSGIMYPHFYPTSGYGTAYMVIDIYNYHDRSQKVSLYAECFAWNARANIQPVSALSNAQVGPNPVQDHTLYIHHYSGPVSITNTLGQTLIQTHVDDNAQSLDVSSLSAGVYFVNLSNGTQSNSFKIIIN